MKFPMTQSFRLTQSFLDKYKKIKPRFGFNGLGEFVFMRTYSRITENGKNETWQETVQRVVEGIYSIQRQHIEDYNLGWNQAKSQKSAQEMYDRIFNFKMLPSGRSLWAMGTDIIKERGLAEALYSCCFLTTENINENPGKPFANAMDFLMCGIGVGADLKGSNKIVVKQPHEKLYSFIVPDSREGWVESLELLINSFFGGKNYIFDYSLIRKVGEPIRTFGGISAGSKPLKELHKSVSAFLTKNTGKNITSRTIADIFNVIGKAVVSGNIRRSAEILIGSYKDKDFMDLKNYKINPDRRSYGWASNNSIYADIGMDYANSSGRTIKTGEPGYIWIENTRKYSRIRATEANYKDKRVSGFNPCGEITLESGELCNLVETFPNHHESLDDYKTTLKYAYLYAKSITLLNTHWPETNRVMLRNRRIGLSMSGVAQFISSRGLNELKLWMQKGYNTAKYYDKIYSDWLAIPESIKITTIKPSGTISLLAGATPGIHFPESQYYIRRVRIANNSTFINVLKKAGHKIEKAIGQEDTTSVVEFPIFIGKNIRSINDISMWEQLGLASFAQKNWSDNSVSITVTFNKKEAKDIANALNIYQFQLKAVSFLPKLNKNTYPQMPYEAITEKEYSTMIKKLKPLNFSKMESIKAIGEKYCTNDTCKI